MNKTKSILLLLMIIICVIGLILSKNEDKEINSNSLEEAAETKIVLYFSNPDNGELTKEYRYVRLDDIKEDMAGTIMKELLKGPENEKLVSPIPNGTTINSLTKDSNKIEIDLSKEFEESSGDELQELQKIYSIVNSLTEITEIDEVIIKVEGKEMSRKVRI